MYILSNHWKQKRYTFTYQIERLDLWLWRMHWCLHLEHQSSKMSQQRVWNLRANGTTYRKHILRQPEQIPFQQGKKTFCNRENTFWQISLQYRQSKMRQRLTALSIYRRADCKIMVKKLCRQKKFCTFVSSIFGFGVVYLLLKIWKTVDLYKNFVWLTKRF